MHPLANLDIQKPPWQIKMAPSIGSPEVVLLPRASVDCRRIIKEPRWHQHDRSRKYELRRMVVCLPRRHSDRIFPLPLG